MGKRDARQKSVPEERTDAEKAVPVSPSHEVSGEANATANIDEDPGSANLATVLGEIRAFRKEFQDFKLDLIKVNKKISEAETRIGNVEDRIQNVEYIMIKMLKAMNEQEDKLVDQESRARRANLRLYNVPEGAEGTSMKNLVEKILKECLDLPAAINMDIERAHRALMPKPTKDEEKPRSILIRFARFTTKEEVLRKAWTKKTVLLEGRRIYFDQDYAPAILRKRKDYAEAKRVLKSQNIRFQTPFPAKLRVFYQDGTILYQTASDATEDMKARGFQVTKITPKENLTEQLSRSAWEMMGRRPQPQMDVDEQRERAIREKLQVFRRHPSSTTEEQ